jgi:hypothetical protein
MAHIKSSAGTRSELPVEPRTNCVLAGVVAFGEQEKGVPYKFYLGRKSCTMLAVGSTSGGLITIEKFFGVRRDGWAIYYDGEVCAGGHEILARGVRDMVGAPVIYSSAEGAAIMARVVFKIDREIV